MADNKATFIVDIVSKGGKIARDYVAGVGKAAREATVNYQNVDKSAKNFHNTQEKGVIGTANSTKSFSKLAETMGGSGIVGAYATLAANIFAVSAAFNALRSAAQVQQILEGLNASGARMGLTLTVAASRVKELSGNLLSSEQAMRSTSQVMAAGFSTKQLERITVVAKDASFALGRNMQDSMDRLTRGIVKLEPELLDELGLMTKLTESNRNTALALGKSETALSSFEKRMGFANAILAEGELKFGGLSQAAGDTTSYDKLAATFANLVKTIFNGINVVGKPIASFLADNQVALLAIGALFTTTITKQIIPVFGRLGQAAEKSALTISKNSVNSLKQLGDLTTDVNSDFNQWTQSVKDGTAVQADYANTLKSVRQEIVEHENTLRTFRNPQGQYVAKTAENVLLLNDEIEVYKHSEQSILAYGRAQNKVSGLQKGAVGIQLASMNQPLVAIAAMKDSFSDLNKSLPENATLMQRVGNTATKAGLGLRAFGAGTLAALPYVALAIAALTALWAVFKSKTTPEQSEYNSRLKDFDEILGAIEPKIAAYNHAQNSSASAALRAKEMLTIQSNAIIELATAYKTVEEAAKAAQKAEEYRAERKNKSLAERERTGVGIAEAEKMGETRKLTGLDYNTKTLNSFNDSLNNGSKETNEILKTLGGLEKLNPRGFNKLVEDMGGPAKINAMSYGQALQTATRIIDNMADSSTRSKTAVDNMTNSFDAADKAAAEFITGSIPTTPFDKLAESSQQVSSAVAMLGIEFRKGNVDGTKYMDLISGLGGKFGQILTPEVMKSVEAFKAAESAMQAYKIANPGKNTKELQTLKDSTNQAGQAMTTIMIRGTQEAARMTAELQKQTRVLNGQIKLYQAQLTTITGLYELTGSGLREQYAQQERVRSLEAQKLKLEITINENILAQNKANIDALKLAEKKYAISQSELKIQERLALIAAAPDPISKAAIAADNSWIQKLGKDIELFNAETENTIKGVELSGAATSAVIENLKNEVSALMAQNLSDAQKEARVRNKNYEVSQKYLDLLKQQATLLQSIGTTQEKLRNIAEGNTNSLLKDINAIQQAAKISRDLAIVDNKNAREGLIISKEVIVSDLARAKTEGQSLDAGQEGLRNLDAEIKSKDVILKLTLADLDNTQRLAILEKVVFDTRKDGLEWQQQSLSLAEKQLSIESDLSTTLLANSQKREEIALSRRNIPLSQEFNKSKEVENAVQAYRLAAREVDLKKDLIDLEYGLLDAQRISLREELATRKSMLLSITGMNEESPAIKQLTMAVANLDRVSNVSAIRDKAKDNLDASLEGLRLAVESASVQQNEAATKFNALSGTFEGIVRLAGAQREAERVAKAELGRKPTNVTAALGDNRVPLQIPGVEAELKKALPVITSTEGYIKQIAEDVKRLVSRAGENTGPIDAKGRTKEALDYFMSQGWNKMQAAGIVANLVKESNLVTNKPGDNGKAIGIAQWHQDRQDIFFNKFGKRLIDATYTEQLKFVQYELKNNEKAAGDLLLAATSAREAARLFDKFYERSAGLSTSGRMNLAAGLAGGDMSGVASTRSIAANDNKPKVGSTAVKKSVEKISADLPPVEVSFVVDQNSTDAIFQELTAKFDTLPEVNIKVNSLNFTQTLSAIGAAMAPAIENLKSLGPNGEAAAAFASGMVFVADAAGNAFSAIKTAIATTNTDAEQGLTKFQASMGAVAAVLQTIGAAVSMVSQIVQSSAQAKEAAIDREIAAEQKRDGKSADSVARIKALEAKKDAIARKAFNTNKKLMMAQAIIGAAAGVAQALGSLPFPANFIVAGITAAMGAAQLAIIAGTQYQSTASSSAASPAMPSTLSIGKRGDSVDLARNNSNVGGELGYLRGTQGTGSNSGNFAVGPGSAYGGPLPRGYGHSAFMVGEKGPEIIRPNVPVSVSPVNDNNSSRPLSVAFHVNAWDGESVETMLFDRRGDIIDMLRGAANESGGRFLENVNTNTLKKANKGGGRRI